MKLLLITAACSGILLSGCTVVEQGRDYAGQGAARAVITECSLSPDQRMKNVEAINQSLEELSYAHRAIALDCDGDNKPDF